MGLFAVILVTQGNPPNMGYCIACFLRDISGGLGFHRAGVVQYIRPEILGLALGAFGAAIYSKEFKVVGGSSTFTRFALAFLGMIGMLVFLGCPVRMALRLAAGDLNALLGLAGLIAGIAIGVQFIQNGFSLGRAEPQNNVNGYLFPAAIILVLVLLLLVPSVLFFSEKGPGAMHAPVIISLISGLLLGILAQRSHFCMIGGIRDYIMFRDWYLLYGFFGVLIVAFIGNLLTGTFNVGFAGQPIAHADGLWNFLGMMLTGIVLVLMGGCPLRQLIAAGEGNTDCAITIIGLIAGAAAAHNMGLAASPKGVPVNGQIATVLGLVITFAIAYFNIKINRERSSQIENN